MTSTIKFYSTNIYNYLVPHIDCSSVNHLNNQVITVYPTLESHILLYKTIYSDYDL